MQEYFLYMTTASVMVKSRRKPTNRMFNEQHALLNMKEYTNTWSVMVNESL